ncbi:MAG: valine--tRNA ligase, partial [Chitinophagia bacterium]|nr:valine--tRNA ligase [Chitinophagia bacterium]
NTDLNYYYPTATLVTAPEIIFFWVARMIMAGYEFRGQKPFSEVYFTGIVRDKQGRKMSKSLGNSPDLLQMIDDAGADMVRFSVMISSPAGNDLLFDESAVEQGRNFSNKLWNAMKLVKGWESRLATAPADDSDIQFAIDWMESRLAQVATEVASAMKEYKLSEGLKTVYSAIWNDFCSWYLEWVKPAMEAPVSPALYHKTVAILEQLLQLLHPYMPFITEEIYHLIADRADGDDLMIKQLPAFTTPSEGILQEGQALQELITAIRDARNKNNLKPKEVISIWVDTRNTLLYNKVAYLLKKQVNAEALAFTSEAPAGTLSLVVNADKLYLQLPESAAMDTGAQREQLLKDLEYYRGFLASVEKKLNNEKFVNNAKPDVIASERKKQADAQEKIKAIEESLG